MQFQKNAIAKIIVAIIVVSMIIILLVGNKAIKTRSEKNMLLSKEKENEKIQKRGVCKFCGNPAIMERYPSTEIIAKMKKLDLEPSFAELQIIKVCNECKSIAGSFRSSKWEIF
jgi:hypothetical protein